jgi:hypothetical protein
MQGYRMGDWLKLADETSGKAAYIQILEPTGDGSFSPVVEEVTAHHEEDLKCDPCTEGGEGSCLDSQCCKNPGQKCYKKNDFWASCKYTCNPTDQDRCEEIGHRSWTPRLPGFPTLYCWQLMRPYGYELDLVKVQVQAGAGIFACDGFEVLSEQGDMSLGKTPSGTEVATLYSEPHNVGRSKDGTAANTEIFVNAWNAVRDKGKWSEFSWVIKMDPDAVIAPDRTRIHIMQRWLNGEDKNCFFRTCNRFPNNPDFPMMYGAMELLSKKAAEVFFSDGWKCNSWYPVAQYGEDLFLSKCLQSLGSETIDDFVLVGDDRCMGGACWDHTYAAYHEYKSADDWMRCWGETNNGTI